MKFFKFFLITAGMAALFFSCSKTNTNVGPSVGTLAISDTTGGCFPSYVNGTYTAGIPLSRDINYIDVTVNVTSVGSFHIATDTVNGMSFASSSLETFGITGANTVRLYCTGKPIMPGLTTFNISYNGMHCTVSLIVKGAAPGGILLTDTITKFQSSALVNGSYTAGVPLGIPDSVVVQVEVTRPGSIFLTSDTVNGIKFSGTGVFTKTGIQFITLTGTGIPQTTGTFNFYVLDSLSDSSKFSIPVVAFGGSSGTSFTLDGFPNACSGFILYGSYTAGVKLQAEDSATTFVTVKKPGPFAIVTSPVNGVVFSATGTFDTAGPYKVTLKGAGLPILPGNFNYSAANDSSTCSFTVNYTSGDAVYTLGGTPGACSYSSINGSYKVDSAVTANNSVKIFVNVVTPGAYKISVPANNGISFLANGNFVTTGLDSVTLTAVGLPQVPGITAFTVPSSTGNCGFSINVAPNVATYSLEDLAYGQCVGVSLKGEYVVATPLTSSNTVQVTVDVSYPGPYSLTTDTANGIIFTGTGVFSTTGTQLVTLIGSGKPTTASQFDYTVTGQNSSCSISVPVKAVGVAQFKLGSTATGDSCTGFVISGTYKAGTPLTSANTVKMQVNVTTIGSYTLATKAAVNGITFSGSGTFTATGVQTVTLTGNGTPTATGTFNSTAAAGTSSCIFSVPVN